MIFRNSKERDEWMKAIAKAIWDNMKKRACNSPDLEKEFRLGLEVIQKFSVTINFKWQT